jgi:hypothetical protein
MQLTGVFCRSSIVTRGWLDHQVGLAGIVLTAVVLVQEQQ